MTNKFGQSSPGNDENVLLVGDDGWSFDADELLLSNVMHNNWAATSTRGSRVSVNNR